MKKNSLLIAGTKSGCGKTLITISLMKAFSLEGKKVAAFKCGPDFIDPMFHKKILNLPSKNLDLFFTSYDETKKIFLEENDSDLSIIEGVMGLYDGSEIQSNKNSSYELAQCLGCPIILVVDAKGMSRSIIAEIAGFISLDKNSLIRGIILNNLPPRFFRDLKNQIEKELKVKVLGYFPNKKNLKIESRHLGLKLPDEITDLKKNVLLASQEISKTVNLSELYKISSGATEIEIPLENKKMSFLKNEKVRIAIAKDEAFCFYYEENLELLKKFGAELVEFSPLKSTSLPENICGLILGGGYPELYAKELEKNKKIRREIKKSIENNLPSLAECGGFMYLHKNLVNQSGKSYKMAGVLPGKTEYKGSLVRFGYVSVKEKVPNFLDEGKIIKGHEFHYFDSTNNGAFCTQTNSFGKEWDAVIETKNSFWGFVHLYYPSCPEFAQKFLEKCRAYANKKNFLS